MAELPDRMTRETDLQRKLSRLSASHRRELRQLMGDPPDPNRVPFEFWEKVRRERESALLLMLLLTTTDSQKLHVEQLLPDAFHDDVEDGMSRVARDWSSGRASFVAKSNVDTMRQRLTTRADYWRKFGGNVPQEQIDSDLAGVIGPRIDSVTAATETTLAQTAGVNGAIGAAGAFGIPVRTRWYTAADDRVCPICAPLHKKIVDLWETVLRNVVAPGGTRAIAEIVANGGPPAHVNCRCFLITAAEAPARRVRTGGMREAFNPDQPREPAGTSRGGEFAHSGKVRIGSRDADGKTVGVPDRKDSDRIIAAHSSAIEKLQKFGVDTSGMEDIQTSVGDESSPFAYATGSGVRHFHTPTQDKTVSEIISDTKKARGRGDVPGFASESLEDMFVHEMAHNIARRLSPDDSKKLESIFAKHGSNVDNLPSFYAQENSSEMWAESVVSVVGGHPFGGTSKSYSPPDPELENFVRRMLKKSNSVREAFDPKSNKINESHEPGWKKVGGSSVHVNADGRIDKGCPGLKGEHVAYLIDEPQHSRDRREARQAKAEAKGITGHDVNMQQAKRLEGNQKERDAFEEVKKAAKRHGVTADEIIARIPDVIESRKDSDAIRIEAKRAAHKMTGLSPSDLHKMENRYKDSSHANAFDEVADELANAHPEYGVKDASDLWELMKQEHRPRAEVHHADVIDEAAAMAAEHRARRPSKRAEPAHQPVEEPAPAWEERQF